MGGMQVLPTADLFWLGKAMSGHNEYDPEWPIDELVMPNTIAHRLVNKHCNDLSFERRKALYNEIVEQLSNWGNIVAASAAESDGER